MCIIIVKPAGVKLDEDVYRECWKSNNDGVGIAYVDPVGKDLVIEKGHMTLKDSLKAIQDKEDLELLIHFRKVSKGFCNKDNTHPFLVESYWGVKKTDENPKPSPRFSFAIVHNGTIDIKTENGESDTRTFVRQVLSPWLNRDPFIFDNSDTKFILEGFFGPRNRLAIMRYDHLFDKSDIFFINKDASGCNSSRGCWFSNYSWLQTQQGEYDFENHVYGGAWGQMGRYQNRPTQVDGESFPDHLGWIWRQTKGEFENLTTKAWIKTLSYRKAMDDEYTFEGVKHSRIPKRSRITPVVPTQTTVLNATPVAGKTEDRQIVVRRDNGVITEDQYDQSYNLAVALRTCDMRHLDKTEKKILRRLAYDHCEQNFGKEMLKDISSVEQITFLRQMYLEEFPLAKQQNISVIDKAIIDNDGIPGIPDETETQVGGNENHS